MVQKSPKKLKILVLMKRFGAGKDMVMQDFGRQIRLFENIAKLATKLILLFLITKSAREKT